MHGNDKKYLLYSNETVRDALAKLNVLKINTILIVVDEEYSLIGSLTDGDLRRGFINGLSFETSLLEFLQPDPLFVYEDEIHTADFNSMRLRNFMVIPIVNRQK